ncbi:hypothetical protein [Adhaeretor mobilis]|uniref:Carboxypeptidase regulatory-like domain-containing protein n=1 Tax=Adhaeretor mobilis TaxID=1930276 RepID=A0A517MTQ4_9BACT|nr:hypothetical protein [Adhaeretor mobilis]QDS98242.1 hypothetical protein HG15A2_15150 [Adhaeretor mobilis]
MCAACLLVGAAGCGSGTRGLAPVSGVVTLDGEPVTTGRIEFHPSSGRPASGEIKSDGRYQLTTFQSHDGAKPGKYRVTITSQRIPEVGPVYKSFEDELAGNMVESGQSQQSGKQSTQITWLVPQKFSIVSTSGLEAEVGDDGGEIDFELQTKP